MKVSDYLKYFAIFMETGYMLMFYVYDEEVQNCTNSIAFPYNSYYNKKYLFINNSKSEMHHCLPV